MYKERGKEEKWDDESAMRRSLFSEAETAILFWMKSLALFV